MDENSASCMLGQADVAAIPSAVQALHFGAISLIAEPCGSTYEALMHECAASAVISFDPNIRPGFVTDETAYRARMDRMAARADIIKVSDEDLDWLAKGDRTEDTIAQWLAAATSIVVVTRGAGGLSCIPIKTSNIVRHRLWKWSIRLVLVIPTMRAC